MNTFQFQIIPIHPKWTVWNCCNRISTGQTTAPDITHLSGDAWLGTFAQQILDHLQVTVLGADEQRRSAVDHLTVNVSTVWHQLFNHLEMITLTRYKQWRSSVLVQTHPSSACFSTCDTCRGILMWHKYDSRAVQWPWDDYTDMLQTVGHLHSEYTHQQPVNTDCDVQGGPKNVPTCLCQNIVKFSSKLLIFGTQMAKIIKLCEVHSFSTSPNLFQCTTV